MSDDNITQSKQDILKRLNRLEGQIKGIKRMMEHDRVCGDILTQIAAVRAATNKLGSLILENYYNKCMLDIINQDDADKAKNELLQTVQKFLSFVDQ